MTLMAGVGGADYRGSVATATRHRHTPLRQDT
jgi:hypothetical protein